MLDCGRTVHFLREQGIEFFAGVPDSLLKHFCAAVHDIVAPTEHVITPNEGSAIALAAGHHLATGKVPLVYLQNSGIGNTVNPLVSLADPGVYGIPMILVIGWRGEPGVSDEPQHRKQGELTLQQLELLGIPTTVVTEETASAERAFAAAIDASKERGGPAAIVVPKNTFSAYETQSEKPHLSSLTREAAIEAVVREIPDNAIVVSTTGKPSRELHELRVRDGDDRGSDFLTVGSMGHASMIALGIALSRPERTVVCLDGDGALLMHMGALGTIGQLAPANLLHVVLNNGAHDSVGGQPTCASSLDLPALASACGYSSVERVEKPESIGTAIENLRSADSGPTLLEIRVACGSRKELGRPAATPEENKLRFMEFIERDPAIAT